MYFRRVTHYRGRLTLLLMLGGAIAVIVLDGAGRVWATPAVGFTATTIVRGRLTDIDVPGRSVGPGFSGGSNGGSSAGSSEGSSGNWGQIDAWLSLQKNRGPADLYVQSNVWQPGGSTGWHIHPGHSLIMVNEGTVTEYEGHDPECKPHVYTKGMKFVDPGGDHIHIIRNEGGVVAQTTALQLIPAGLARRIDVEDPGNCHF